MKSAGLPGYIPLTVIVRSAATAERAAGAMPGMMTTDAVPAIIYPYQTEMR